MKIFLKLGCLLCASALCASAADIAVLHNGFTIRHERRQVIGPTTRLYPDLASTSFVDVPTAEIDHFEKDLSPAPSPIEVATTPTAPPKSPIPATVHTLKNQPPPTAQNLNEIINSISDQQNIDPDLINSVIHAESGFNPRAVSPKGARGLMQLMPQTASKLGVSNSFDARSNVDGGTKYLRELLERYNFDLIKALAAYNAGPQRVEKYHGVPPYYETQAYIARIVRDFNRKKLAEKKAAEQAKRKAQSSKAPARKTATAAELTQQPVR